MRVSLDFETRSAADLPKVGTFRYAQDESTEVMCLAFRFEREENVHLWHPAYPAAGLPEEGLEELAELAEHVKAGAELWAFNAMFERCIWEMVLRQRIGWLPSVPRDAWRCSAALCATYALPRRLEDAAEALGLAIKKDMAGSRLMKKMSKPRKPTKADPDTRWHEQPDDLRILFEYCKQDVRVECAVGDMLPRGFWKEELGVWQLDQEINLRGVYLDRPMAEAALRHAADCRVIANDRVRRLSRGSVPSTTKRDDLLEWVRERGVAIPDTQKATLAAMLGVADEDDEDVEIELAVAPPIELPVDVRQVLEIWRSVNRASVKKYLAMLKRSGADGRIRDLLRYHGASTGRWAGQGIQPQNFPRGNLGKVINSACRDIAALPREDLEVLWGDVMELLSSALRGAITAGPGCELLAADYAAIEARGTFWLAGDEDALEVIRKSDRKEGPDIYRVQAAEIYGTPVGEITKDSPERQLGKQAILGLGYQMGAPKFVTTCANVGITIDLPFAVDVVKAYRELHAPVRNLWAELEELAIQAIRNGPGAEPVWDKRHRTAWAVRGRFLHCRLPSGRLLSYYRPRITIEPFLWTDPITGETKDLGPRPKVRFWGIHTKTKKWSEQHTYGGKLTENVVQALSRDIMAAAMPRVEAAGYPVVLTVHDEIVSEVPKGYGSLKEYEALVAEAPAWADGLPIAAEGWRGVRYRK